MPNNYLQLALNGQKQIKSIYEVQTGIKCNCYCPVCNNALIAKNKDKYPNQELKLGEKTAHFAHSNGSDCPNAGETMLHLIAKEVLKDLKTLLLPSITYNGIKLKEQELMTFDDCLIENRVTTKDSYIKPDAILTKGKSQLYIEFYKTHLVKSLN